MKFTDEERKLLDAAYERAYNYDPDDDEVDSKYDDDFKKWEEEFIKKK
jgi:hypothetical protein